ncbi:hypothetical protein YSY43_39760 [Paenibacillus sp. YSY-4.3]
MLEAVIVLVILFLLIAIWSSRRKQKPSPKEKDLMQVKSNAGDSAKKVIFLVIDSLMAESVDRGIEQKELPTLQYLIERGQYYKDMVSSFPTMSVTIDSSLLTGSYPDRHHVPALNWYSVGDNKLINYGTGPTEVMKIGVNQVMADALMHLNGSHLNPELPTIYEELSRAGKKTGSINGLIYRGPVPHTLSLPAWMHGPTSMPESIPVMGPDFLALGSLTNPLEGIEDLPGSLIHRLGINSEFSISTASYLIKEDKLPDFLYIYLPDMDQQIHKKGPSDLSSLKDTDQQLQTLLQNFGSLEKALEQAIVVIIGDSGMTKILPANENPVIELFPLLQNFNVFSQGDAMTDETEIVLAVNETMAYVYNLKARQTRDIAAAIRADSRIDIIAWRDGEWICVSDGASQELRFKTDGELTDPYKQTWTVEGEPQTLDLKINQERHTLDYERYPDVLRRLYGALHSHDGDYLVLTAKPGYELADQHSPTHKGGGSHGSLGHAESLVPLIISGTEERPENLRIVDIKPFLMKLVTKQ